ncbi:hypothetical protein L7F22_035388 [Adiantum nelumboides]|nr:hypothetical protein [Adiantum nelumboides]
MTYVYVIRCGESSIAHDVVRLTALGQRQVRALAMSLLSRGLRFDALFSSPTPRCKQTALSVCQEINFNQDRLEFGESLMDFGKGSESSTCTTPTQLTSWGISGSLLPKYDEVATAAPTNGGAASSDSSSSDRLGF